MNWNKYTREELVEMIDHVTTIRIEDEDGELVEEIKYPESKFLTELAIKSMFRRTAKD